MDATDTRLEELQRTVKALRSGEADPVKPWAQRRGSEALLTAAVPVVAAVVPLVNQLLGGRALTPVEFVALVLGPCAVAVAYVLGRAIIKAEMVRAGAKGDGA